MRLFLTCIALTMMVLIQPAGADEGSKAPTATSILGSILVSGRSSTLDKFTMSEIDKLVPKMIELGQKGLIRIDAHSSATGDKESRVKKSLLLAQQVEKYLRLKHHLNLDLYIGVLDEKQVAKGESKAKIVVFYDNYDKIKLEN